jgi:predicted P-loop ATPase
MLVLVGDQGRGKSSFLRYLALNDKWYNDNFSTLDSGRAVENLRGMWIVELAELQATKRTKDVETIKSFITSRVDTYRAPYGRRTEQRPRMCVLAGTSNPVDFLTDKTGNRRFLPITCGVHSITFDMFSDEIATKHEMMQAWGEIMSEFQQAGGRPKLVLPKRLEREAITAPT